jgi:hypothetical protein
VVVGAILAAHGAIFAEVVTIRTYLTDMDLSRFGARSPSASSDLAAERERAG